MILIELLSLLYAIHTPHLNQVKPVISEKEMIILVTDSESVQIEARIDTGAGMSSVAQALYNKYKFPLDRSNTKNTHCPNGQAYIKSANGTSCRKRVKIRFILADILHETTATVADRSTLEHKILIGRRDLVQYLIQVSPTVKAEETEEEEN